MLISNETPLISNLNMAENIALIKEVHEGMSIKAAEGLACEYLEKIGIGSIALKRISACQSIEIFYVMLIRALMMPQEQICILTPFLLIKHLSGLDELLSNIALLNDKKDIIILDTYSNELHYKGCECHIVK